MKHLEGFVNWHQFLCNTSEYAGFNRAYESAVAQFSGGAAVQELYIIQLATASRVRRREEYLQFSFVPPELISSHPRFSSRTFVAWSGVDIRISHKGSNADMLRGQAELDWTS